MSGDKVTGFSPGFKGRDDFKKVLALLALSDAKHDFKKKQAFDKNIELQLRVGLPLAPENSVDALDEDEVLDLVFTENRETLFTEFAKERPAGSSYELKVKYGRDGIKTHDVNGLKIYDNRGNIIKNGKDIVDRLQLDNANFVVDLDAIGFMCALKNGPPELEKKVKYLLISESFNDPANRQGLKNEVFNPKGVPSGITMEGLLQYGGGPIIYSAWNDLIQQHYNDFYSNYTFQLSPVLGPTEKESNVSLTITPPSGSKIFIDDPKTENAIDAIKKKIGNFIDLLRGKTRPPRPSESELFQANVKYQQKRSGDWLQALAVQDIVNRTFIDKAGTIAPVTGETYFVTHDRIALTYALLTGVNAIFVHNINEKDKNRELAGTRWAYLFRSVKPAPIRGIVPVSSTVSIDEQLLRKYTRDERSNINDFIRYLEQQGELIFTTHLDKTYSTSITKLCKKILVKNATNNIADFINNIKELLEKLALYIFECNSVPNYIFLLNQIEKGLELLDKINSGRLNADDISIIRGFDYQYNNIRNMFPAKLDKEDYKQRITSTALDTFRASNIYKSVSAINKGTAIKDYEGLYYIRNNSFNEFNIYDIRNKVTETFENALRLPYFNDIIPDTNATMGNEFPMRLLLLGLVQLWTTSPDPKIIQIFNKKIEYGLGLTEDEIFKCTTKFTATEYEVSEILINMEKGYNTLASYHLHNDPIFRKSLSTNPIRQYFYNSEASQRRGGGVATLTQVMQNTVRTRAASKRGSKTRKQPTKFPGTGAKLGYNVNETTQFGHNPFTPLLYLQFKIIQGLEEIDYKNSDYKTYIMLGNIINIFIDGLKNMSKQKGGARDFTKMPIDQQQSFFGIIIKYLLYVFVPKHKGLEFITPREGVSPKEIAYLLSLLTDSVGLRMDEDAERKMDELLGDAYVKHILRQWTSQIQNLIVRNDIGELKGLQRYTARNISYIRVLLATEARRFASRPISNFKSKNATPEIEIVRALLPPAPAPVPAPIATQTRAATKKRRLSERNAEQEIAHVPRNRINITRKRPRTGAMSNN